MLRPHAPVFHSRPSGVLGDVLEFARLWFKMEPEVKRLKTDNDTKDNGISDEKSDISRESPFYGKKRSDKQDLETEPAVDAGNEQLPMCKHGAECTQTDLIHFAEFWHPTAEGDGDENNNKGGESCEENECEVVEFPYFDVESTQPVFDEYCDSESEDGEDGGTVTIKTHEDRLSSDNLGSQ